SARRRPTFVSSIPYRRRRRWRRLWQWQWFALTDAGAFLHDIKLVGREIGQFVHFPAGPVDFDAHDLVVAAQPERQRQFALRTVTRPAVYCLPLLRPVGQGDGDLRADAVAVRFVADGLEPDESRLIAVVVSQQIGRAAVGRQQDVEIAVVVIIAVSRAAPDDGALERATSADRRLNEFGFALAPEE